MVKAFATEFQRYRVIAEKAMAQVSEEALNHVPRADANSIAMLVRHISGNLRSRFTDFLTSDGEKPWRDRDDEFVERKYSRAELNQMWAEGWQVVEGQLSQLTDAHMAQTVTIRNEPLTVHAALCRSVTHVATHVGQIVLLARVLARGDWEWISVPKGQSQTYVPNPIAAKRPR